MAGFKENVEEKIQKMEQEMDRLADMMFEDPSACTYENINRLNYLSVQVEIMKGRMVYNVNMTD